MRVITRLNIGGPAQHVVLLAAGLERYGWRTTLVTGRIDPHEGDMSDFARAHAVDPLVIPTLRNGAGPLADLRSCAALYRLFRRERPAVVHLHLLKARLLGGIAARLAGVPVVVETFHGTLFAEYYRPAVTRLLLAFERLVARWMRAAVAVSAAVAEEVIALRVTPAEKVRVITLGLELERFLHAERWRGTLRAELNLPAGVPLIGAVGRLVPIKGLATLVDAAAQVVRVFPQATVLIVGDGPARPELEARVLQLGLRERVRFLGWRRDLDRIYADLDLVVLPSLNEGTPVAVIEAMAAARPVVATRVGGVPDVVQDGATGVLIPPRDPAGLANAVVALLEDPARAKALGEAARRAVYPRFAAARLVDEMDLLYRSLTGAGAPSGQPAG